MEKLLAQHQHLQIDHCLPEFEKLIKEKRQFLDTTRGNFYKFKNVLEEIPNFSPSIVK